jgi:hypothetical protein
MGRGTPVASLMVVGPRVEVKAVKGHALRSDRDDSHARTDFAVEPILVHAEVRRCIPKSNQTWRADARFDGRRTGFRYVRRCTDRGRPIVGHVRGFGSRVVAGAERYTPHRIPAEGIADGRRCGPDVTCRSRDSSRGRYRRRATRGPRFVTSQSAGHETAVPEESARAASGPRPPTGGAA